jgi:RNA polymerase sigma-70 factor (ECF subfamily)
VLDARPNTSMSRERAADFARAHVQFAWRVARRLGLGPADAEDVAQRAMLVAARRVETVTAGSERAFVFRTVANLVSRVYRARRRKPEEPEEAAGELVDHEHDPERLLEQRRAREALDSILQTLSPGLRAAFVLFEIEGLSQREIAVALGIPTGTVASRLRRAREEFLRLAARRGLVAHSTQRLR